MRFFKSFTVSHNEIWRIDYYLRTHGAIQFEADFMLNIHN